VTETAESAAKPFPLNVIDEPDRAEVGEALRLWVTVADPDAVSPARSAAVNTCAPAAAGGSLNEQLNTPFDVVVTAVQAVPPLQLTVTDETPANPAPVKLTFPPTATGTGVIVSEGTTVSTAVAEFERRSVAENECGPEGIAPIVNVQLNPPLEAVIAPQATVESCETFTSVVPAYPVPVKVTVVPTAALAGETARVAVTVKWEVAEFPLASVAVNG